MINNQFSTPFMIDQAGHTSKLKRIHLESGRGDFDYNEAWLQNLLFENPSSLPVQEIDSGYQELIPICTELGTSAGPLDILYVTPQGKLVILEAKLWRNPEARRKVVAQVLDYAKELNRWDYEELQKQVARRVAKPGNLLYERVKARYPDIDEATFVDEVSRSLSTGQFMLLIAGDGIREGAKAIADFLEDVGYLQFTFGLIEVGLYEAPDKHIMVQPRVIAKTVIINRTVIELASPALQVRHHLTEHIAQEKGGLPSDPFYLPFWTELVNELELDDAAQVIPNPAKGTSLWFRIIPKGTEHAWINAYFSQSSRRVGVYFRIANSPIGDMIYQHLEAEKDKILSELPDGAAWDEIRGNRSVEVILPLDDVQSLHNWEKIKVFFANNINAFVNTFRARVERIASDIVG